MKRNFEDRKRSRKIIKSKENQVIIKALNMYGRVPEIWELLEEIERLKSIIKEVREKLLCYGETFDSKIHQEMQKELLEILERVDEE